MTRTAWAGARAKSDSVADVGHPDDNHPNGSHPDSNRVAQRIPYAEASRVLLRDSILNRKSVV